MLCPFWPSEAAARPLSPSPPPAQLLALNTKMEEDKRRHVTGVSRERLGAETHR